jgi:D-alanyl-D-alanine carboxypeptidase
MAMLTRAHGRPLVLVVLDAGSLATGAQDVRKLRRWGARRTESQGDAARTAAPTRTSLGEEGR